MLRPLGMRKFSKDSWLLVPLSLALFACGPEGNAAAPPSKTPTAATDQAAVAPKDWPFAQASMRERDAERLQAMATGPSPQKWNWVPPGRKERYGHAELIVPAPPAEVLGRVVDFAHYKEFASSTRLSTVRVVAKDAGGTSLYFRVPIMKGAIEIWYIVKFAPAVTVEDGASVVDGHMVRGNVDGVHIAFTVRPAPDNKTWLSCDLGMDPKVPAPQDALDEELRDAAGDVIRALSRPPAP